ncbi:calcium-dependent lipid-binding family protein [Striga asiatica]|uniref:Calcium-dependent lipid-binding family protein n=1 Tax=Striga asiatica TaxID=4170 RepID=A0A5A7QWA5_STRAF|nr:calcium-dependent lipid-binding family protein [Striga asiatica]
MTERRTFEITLISATDLDSTGRRRRPYLFPTRAYAWVSVSGKEKRTPVDRHGQSNPAWNFAMAFSLRESAVQSYNAMLVVKIFGRRPFVGFRDRYIGEVHTPVKELFDYAGLTGGNAVLDLPLMKGCATAARGRVRFAYRFSDTVVFDKSPRPRPESFAGWTQC